MSNHKDKSNFMFFLLCVVVVMIFVGIGISMLEQQNKTKMEVFKMATVDKVKVSIGYTKNMGNYESIRIEVGAEVEVTEDEKASDVVDKLRENVRAQLKKAVAEEVDAFRK